MKLHQLRDVVAVADHGSLRAAARHLNIAQSAITKSVQQLEKELDAPLFERHKRGVVLTSVGVRFVERARTVSNELARAQEEIKQHRGTGTGRVTVSLSTVPHLALLPSVIKPFSQRYPDLQLTVLEALGFYSAEDHLRNGAIDAYIGVAPTTRLSPEYHSESLFANQRAVICRTDHPLARANSLKQLIDCSWVVSSTTYAQSSFTSAFGKYHLDLPTRITYAGSLFSQAIFLLNSDMLMIAPKQVVDFAPYKGHLVRVPIREVLDAPEVVMVRRAASPLTPAAEYFCDLIRRASASLGSVPVTNRRRRAS